ncbi:MAG: EVE domain-containing protein, partial [Thermoanaerobaculia bacterium]
PTHYSWDDLVRDGRTVWSGVRNPVAQKNLRSVEKGDRIFFYHTGDEKAIVGVAEAAGDAYDDPSDTAGKFAAVDVVPIVKLAQPVTLSAVKADGFFRDFALVRISRLSVMPVSDAQWSRIERMGRAAR